MRMRIVVLELEIFKPESEDVIYLTVQFHGRQLPRLPRELQPGLLDMVRVEVNISKSVNEIARLKPGNLSHHQQEQRIAGYIEGNPQKDISASLVELAGELSFRHIKLVEKVAGGKSHGLQLPDIPGAHDESA